MQTAYVMSTLRTLLKYQRRRCEATVLGPPPQCGQLFGSIEGRAVICGNLRTATGKNRKCLILNIFFHQRHTE
jgi:hypothetical protein